MIKLLGWILFFMSTTIFAQDVEILIDPRSPVAGETFSVIFTIESKSMDDPYINFDPSGMEVLGRENGGVSTRTTYINGQLSVKRSMSVVYQMVANRSGSAYLRNISVEVGDKTIKHPTVTVRVLSAPLAPKDFFLKAEVSKKEVFEKESLLVRYYIYNKKRYDSFDIKQFPKLGKFIKRVHQEAIRPERVKVNHEIYERRVIYTAQLYADKPGTFKIDPMSASIVYYDRSRNDPFSAFGFGTGRAKKKSLRSKEVEIRVMKLPADGVPKSFTGLVGKHSFDFTLNKNKFVVNEPIEMTLKVKGKGALELFEAPAILSRSGVEEFDSNADLNIGQDLSATKTFKYTYLARENQTIDAQEIPFSYFNPDTFKYETVKIKIPQIIIAGTTDQSYQKKTPSPEAPGVVNNQNTNVEAPIIPTSKVLTFWYKTMNTYLYNMFYINVVLGGLFLVLLLLRLKEWWFSRVIEEPDIVMIIKKKGFSYGRLYNFLSSLLGSDKDMICLIEDSSLSKGAKKYYNDLFIKCENEFKKGNETKSFPAKNKYLKEVLILIKKQHDEDSAL